MEDLEKGLHISELYDLNHRHDNNLNSGYDYQNNILKVSLSDRIYDNDITEEYLTQLQDLIATTIDSNVITRNWFNHTVSKYYTKHNN